VMTTAPAIAAATAAAPSRTMRRRNVMAAAP
jgi:hypothetical protein